MSDSPELKVYTKRGCPWCVEAVKYLKNGSYTFEEIDVSDDRDKFREMEDVSGQTYAPTLTYGDLVLADFGVDELAAFLGENGIAP